MKNLIVYLFAVLLMLQSCYSYKTIDLKQTMLKEGEIYKIKQENKFVKAILKAKTDSTLTFLIKKNEIQTYTNIIKEIKVKKFSVLKTIGFVVGTIGTVTLVSLVAISLSDFNFDFSDVSLPN